MVLDLRRFIRHLRNEKIAPKISTTIQTRPTAMNGVVDGAQMVTMAGVDDVMFSRKDIPNSNALPTHMSPIRIEPSER